MLLVLLLIYPLVISRTIKLFIWNDLLHYDAILAESFPSEGWETPPPKKLEKTLTELTFKATKVELAVLRYTYVMGSSNQTKGSFSLSVRQETSGNSTLKVDFSSSLHYRTNLPVFSNMTWQLLTTNSTDCTLMDDGWVEKSPGQADNNLPNELFCFSIFTRAVQSASKILETIPEPEKSTFFWVRSMFTNPDFFRASLVKDAFHEKYNSFGWMRSQIEGKQLSWQNVPRNITELAALAPPKFRSVSKCPDLLLPANANKRAIVFYCLHKRSSQTQCEWVETEEGVYISPLVAVRDGGHGFWCTKWGFGPLLCTADFDYSMQGTFLGLKLLPYMCLIEQSAEDLVPYNEFENWISASV